MGENEKLHRYIVIVAYGGHAGPDNVALVDATSTQEATEILGLGRLDAGQLWIRRVDDLPSGWSWSIPL